MNHLRPLEQALAEHLPLHLARIKFIACFLIAIIQVKTVNLDQIATAFPGKAKKASNYKRLQRFLRFLELPYALVADLVVKLLVCWAHQVGEWSAQQRPLKIKKHGYKAQSTFRYGFDHLRRILTNFGHFDPIAWQMVIRLLSCT
jgi:hypothetical protein